MHDFRHILGKLTVISNREALGKQARRLALGSAKLFRSPKSRIRDTLDGIDRIATFCESEAAQWLDPDDLHAGKTGAFDACDLRHWLVIAGKSAVPSVPAREIMSLSEEEISSVDQAIKIPQNILKTIEKGLQYAYDATEIAETKEACAPDISRDAIAARLFDAMDDVPWDSIVRSNIAGPSTLKSFAGAGVLDRDAQGWSPDNTQLEIGPGWVRHGNRRRVDATDSRFIETFAAGHKPRLHYLARPWIQAARYAEGPDPHRHGTPFAGKGKWPCEWRVFVENGRIIGVASYYGWTGEATPENARKALEAASLADRMISQANKMGLATRYMDIEILRMQVAEAEALGRHVPDHILRTLERFPRDGINATLDFIEGIAEDGTAQMMFLEGGPAHTPIGGGHPCAFAGNGARDKAASASICEGVALKLMENVVLADPATWIQGDLSNHILSWDDAHALADQP